MPPLNEYILCRNKFRDCWFVWRYWVLRAFQPLQRSLVAATNFKMATRAFSSQEPVAGAPPSLNPIVRIEEEEVIPGYEPTSFYPVNPGDVLRDRYKTLAKFGWGTCSTVWLARDLSRYASVPPYCTLLTHSQGNTNRPICYPQGQQLRFFGQRVCGA